MLKIIIKSIILLKLIILSACTILPGINDLQTKKRPQTSLKIIILLMILE